MTNIYQQIWDADQYGSGVQPILDNAAGNREVGYVKVNSNLKETDKNLRVITEAVIPDSKRRTYDLCRVLFDNYSLPERDVEVETPEEREEIHDLVHAMMDTAPMQIARDYVSQMTGTSITRERWYNTIMDLWFRRFSMGGDPHLTGFEHVIVGEQEGSKAQGYHFWYKYYLDDGFARKADGASEHFSCLTDDRIVYMGSKQSVAQDQFPESVIISYRWNAPDYDRNALRPLTKKVGGFFVGCSIEGLLAIGSVRAHIGTRAPKEAIINGARYSLKVYRSENNRHIRTFYPVFLGPAENQIDSTPTHVKTDTKSVDVSTAPVTTSKIRIIAALINPKGHDLGKETVTLINIGSKQMILDDWHFEDKNGKSQFLSVLTIKAGETVRIKLKPGGIQLSNKGGHIKLIDTNGNVVHTINYSKGQAKTNGETVLF